MKKSLRLQADLTAEFGTCVFDVTLDCEDGAPAGGETEHAALVAELVLGAPVGARVAVRVHPVDHPHFDADIAQIAGSAAARLCHVMLPKVESVADVQRAAAALDAVGARALPLHVLIESPAAVQRAFDIAAQPRVQSLSFGLMDFVSAHGGAIPASAMTLAGQFSHPHVWRAKLDIAAACHAHGKVASHNVVTELKDLAALQHAARRAAAELAYTRMWSIHPDQIRPIIAAFTPDEAAIETATAIIERAAASDWAPVQHEGCLHDRASYRYHWQVIERAHQTGHTLPANVRAWFPA
ncbi:MAG: CoA ester lyase [Hydrogenophaga sp.]|nr:CoA ester lyase [Hydrogenophaga sp.]